MIAEASLEPIEFAIAKIGIANSFLSNKVVRADNFGDVEKLMGCIQNRDSDLRICDFIESDIKHIYKASKYRDITDFLPTRANAKKDLCSVLEYALSRRLNETYNRFVRKRLIHSIYKL